MNDLNGVIEGLKELREYADSKIHQIVSPDNWSVYSRLRDLIDETDNKALALLKKQEARVMTLEELQAIETPWNRNTPPYLWVEGRSATTESRWMSWGFMHDFVRLPGTIGVQNYGLTWRVWNLQPTSEQMRDTKWEDEDAE